MKLDDYLATIQTARKNIQKEAQEKIQKLNDECQSEAKKIQKQAVEEMAKKEISMLEALDLPENEAKNMESRIAGLKKQLESGGNTIVKLKT